MEVITCEASRQVLEDWHPRKSIKGLEGRTRSSIAETEGLVLEMSTREPDGSWMRASIDEICLE
jgi:hypothetical protein